jgi:hypothetical protein
MEKLVSTDAAFATGWQRGVGGSLAVGRRRRQRQRRWRQREARWWRKARWQPARWQQHGGCGGFTGTVRECANARAFKRHQRANVRVFILGRGRRDDSADGIVVVGSGGGARGDVHLDRQCTAATAADADGDTDVKPNLIYYYLFIYHYIVLIMHVYGETGLYSVGSFCSEPVEFWVCREFEFFVR